MTTTPHHLLTPRDIEILTALDHSPLTVEQLLKWSTVFEQRFQTTQRVRGRLQLLREAGWVQSWPYASTTRGAVPDYYKLTLAGYRLLYGADARQSTKRQFAEVRLAHQHHTRSLADFLVHTVVAASNLSVRITDYCRENTLRLEVGTESLYPDAAFQLIPPTGPAFGFLVERDNGTERIRSPADIDSWHRKIRLYDQYQDLARGRFRVLVLTNSADRLLHILAAAVQLIRNPQRTLFYGVRLQDYLAAADPLCAPCFTHQRGGTVSMLPPTATAARPLPTQLAQPVRQC